MFEFLVYMCFKIVMITLDHLDLNYICGED